MHWCRVSSQIASIAGPAALFQPARSRLCKPDDVPPSRVCGISPLRRMPCVGSPRTPCVWTALQHTLCVHQPSRRQGLRPVDAARTWAPRSFPGHSLHRRPARVVGFPARFSFLLRPFASQAHACGRFCRQKTFRPCPGSTAVVVQAPPIPSLAAGGCASARTTNRSTGRINPSGGRTWNPVHACACMGSCVLRGSAAACRGTAPTCVTPACRVLLW